MRMVGLNHLKLRSLSNSRSWEKKTTMPWWRWRGYALANLFYLACAQFDELLDMNEAKTFLSTAAFDTWYSDLKDLVEPESKLYRPDFDGKQDLDDKQVLIDKQVLDDRQILVENLASSINKVVSDLKMLAAKQVMIEKIVVDINKFIDDEVLSNKQGLVQMLRDTIKDTLDTKQVFDDKQIFDDQRGLIEQLVSSIKTVLDVDRFFDNKQLLVQQLILAIKKVLADKQVLAGSQVFTDKQALSDEQGLVHKLISTFKQVLADKKVLNDEQVLAERHALVKELLLGVKEGMTAKKVSDDTHVYTDKLVFASMGTILPLSNGESRIPEVIAFAVQSEEMHALGSRLEDIYLDRLIQVSEADKIWEEMGLINYIKSLGTGDYANIAITKLLIKLNEKGGTSLVDDVVAAAPSLGSADLCDYFYHAALVITKREAIDVPKKLASETEGDEINVLGHQHFDLLVKYATFSKFPKLMVDHLRNVLIDKAILAYKKKSLYLDFVKDANSVTTR